MSSGQHQCPVWTVYNYTSQLCECSKSLMGIVQCHVNNQSSASLCLKACYCMSQYSNGSGLLQVVSNCPFSCSPTDGHVFCRDIEFSSTGDDPICSEYKRRGPMCGLCEHNHTPPAYSYNFTCVECTNYKMNWLKYTAVAYLPLTVFYFMVLLLKISATTGSVTALVTIVQLVTSSGANRFYYASHHFHATRDWVIEVLSVLNLDFFKSYYHPFCLHPSMTTIQVFLLEYLVGVYPLLLVAITYFLVKLHDRYSLVVYLWRPCYRVFSCFSSKLNIKTSLVQAFATFILLSYVKICNVSFDILTPARKYLRPDGSEMDKQYWYYNGTLEFFGKDHIPYAALAIVMSLLFNILPLLLLILYPFRFFRKLLYCLKLDSSTLHIFMDSFYGCYCTKSNYYRIFATFYIFLRHTILLLFAVFGDYLYRFYAGYAFTLALVLVALIKPYHNKWQNIFDTLLLLCASSYFQFKSVDVERYFMSQTNFHSVSFANMSMLFPVIYVLCIIVSFFIPRCCIVKVKEIVNGCLHKDLEEPLPHRLQQSNECSPLIK